MVYVWISYVRDAAIKPKSLWKSYVLDSVWYGQREQTTAHGKVMSVAIKQKSLWQSYALAAAT